MFVPRYAYMNKPRFEGCGGGLAVIYQADVLVKEVVVPLATSFECMAFTLTGFSQLQVVLIYCPPKVSSFTDFLAQLS